MLQGLSTTVLYYPRCPGEVHFIGYSDSDHAGDIDSSKSTSGTLFEVPRYLAICQAAGGGSVQLRGRVHSGLHCFDSGALAHSTAW
jgi:hypothetical protein